MNWDKFDPINRLIRLSVIPLSSTPCTNKIKHSLSFFRTCMIAFMNDWGLKNNILVKRNNLWPNKKMWISKKSMTSHFLYLHDCSQERLGIEEPWEPHRRRQAEVRSPRLKFLDTKDQVSVPAEMQRFFDEKSENYIIFLKDFLCKEWSCGWNLLGNLWRIFKWKQ